MMKRNDDLTELVFVLDRSGSMQSLTRATIDGFNRLLLRQKELPGRALVTTVLFDDYYELLHDRTDLQAVRPMTERDYFVRGCTALLDAVGRTIHRVGNAQKHDAPERRPGHTLFVITTDGLENASREFDQPQVKRLVEEQTRKYGWEFLFLGANIDAVQTAGGLGIRADRSCDFVPDEAGMTMSFDAIGETICCTRACMPFSANWKDELDADFQKRGEQR